jgi:hypothetical protein
MGGMFAATFVATLFVPLFYVLVQNSANAGFKKTANNLKKTVQDKITRARKIKILQKIKSTKEKFKNLRKKK